VKLEQNYRSTATILRAASGLVRHNVERKEKTLRTDAADGELVRILVSEDDLAEAETVGQHMRRLLARYRPADLAVIYRTNAQSRPFEQVLARERIPHVLVGGRKFYERMEVRDILAYLRVTLNPDDDVALLRIVNTPSRGLGDKAVDSMRREAAAHGLPLREAARRLGRGSGRTSNAFAGFSALLDGLGESVRTLPLGEFVLHVATRSGYLDALRAQDQEEAAARIDNVHELARAAGEGGGARDLGDDADVGELDAIGRLQQFMDRATLASPTDDLPDAERGAVTLLTAHLAKGLEFPVVFMVGMVEKSFPHARAEFGDAVEEERRLAYVGITRARERLFLSYPMRRRAPEGWWDDATLSRFVRELPGDCLAWPPGVRPISSAAARPAVAPTPPPWRGGAGHSASTRRPPIPIAANPPLRGPVGPPAGRRVMKPESLEAFREGVEVLHPVLGVGTIARREGIPSNPRLTIHFSTHGPRTVFAVSAGLSVLLP
jgi:DNA helicase-2/ATP-dependent DNA helicase PcrA